MTSAAATPIHPPPSPGGDWPRTTRLLPWGLAAFLVMLWLVPFDAIELAVPAPVDPLLDRLLLVALAAMWLSAVLTRSSFGVRPRRLTVMDAAVAVFVLLALSSVLVNAERIAFGGEFDLALKKLVLLVSYATFFVVVSTSLRTREVRSFCVLVVGLAVITALGTLWEYRMHTNVFFDWADRLAPPGFEVEPENADPRWGRRNITGPTRHGLAVTAMLAMALPFAVLAVAEARRQRAQLVYGAATLLILAGAVATQRKSAIVAPAVAVLVLLLLRRRDMVRLLPLGIAAILAIQALAPGALGSIRGQLQGDRLATAGTVQDRVSDYEATRPDRHAHLALGRGYGTYDADTYRILDNQYLGVLVSTGLMGLGAYVALWLAAIALGRRASSSPDRGRAAAGVGVAAAAAVFAAVSALFDVMAFPNVPYLFLFFAGLGVVAASEHRGLGTAPVTAPHREQRTTRARDAIPAPAP